MSRVSFYYLIGTFFFLYSSFSFAHSTEPVVAPGTPVSVKFWMAPDYKYDQEIRKIFGKSYDRYSYFAQFATYNSPVTDDSKYYKVSPTEMMFERDDLQLLYKIMLFANFDKKQKMEKSARKVNAFLERNYKVQILPETIYEDAHLPRPFYLHELRDWAFEAVKNNDINTLRALLDNYNVLNVKNTDGYGLLSYAALNNNAGIALFLIHRGANLNETNSDDSTPLSIATENNNADLVKILTRGVNNDYSKDPDGKATLDYAQ